MSDPPPVRPLADVSPGTPSGAWVRGDRGGRARVVARGVLAVAVLVGCEEVITDPAVVARVEVSPPSAEIAPGDQIQLSASLYDDGGNSLTGYRVSWSSDDASVVTVDGSGMATGVARGDGTVQATVEGLTGEAAIRVRQPAAIVLDRSSLAFSGTAGGADPASVQVAVTNGGDGTIGSLGTAVTYDTGGSGWLQVTLAAATAPTSFTVSARLAGLAPGTYGATVSVSSPTATNSPVTMGITLQVRENVPAAPSALAVTATTDSTIDLSWADNSDNETSFVIQRRWPDDGTFVDHDTVPAGAVAYTDTLVAPDGRYTYRVRACAAPGCSPYSNQATALTPPMTPTGLAAAAVSTSAIDLTWTDVSATETEVRIERRTGATAFAQVGTAGADATAFSDTGLAASTTYDYRVRACNAGGCSAYSAVASATTQAVTTDPIPAAPSGLAFDSASGSVIHISWVDNASNETRYQVERSIPGGSFTAVATGLAPDATTFADGSVSVDTEYVYRDLACNAGGCSTPSATVLAVTLPVAPTGLSATPASNARIDLAWTDASATETSFRAERSADGGVTFVLAATVGASVSTYSDASLAAATTYTYRVQACNAAGCSPFSATAAATTLATPPPADPTGLVATLAPGFTQADLAWVDNATDETSYTVQRSVDRGTFADLPATLGPNATSYSDTGLGADHVYAYRVEACSAAGCSAYSNVDSVITPPVAPSAPTATVVSAGQVDLAWTDNSLTETSFEIERSTGGGAFTALATVAGGVTAYSDLTTTQDATYAYRIRACNGTGCSAYSGQGTATTAPTAPSGLGATAASASLIDLTWTDNAATEDSIRIERQVNGGGFARIAAPGANTMAYADNTVTADGIYGYRVQACNTGGCSAFSNVATDTTPPIAPTGVGAVADSATGITVSWTDGVATETRFELQRRTGVNAYAAVAGSPLAAGTTSYVDTGLTPGTTYDYRVRACNTSGCSAWVTTSTATPQIGAPAAPSGLSATAASTSLVNLAWVDNATTEDSVRIERQVNGGAFARIAAPGTNSTAYGDNTVTADNVYGYRVQACNAGGCSTFSNVASDTTPPIAPAGLGAVVVSDTAITLNWTDGAVTETYFEVQRRTGGPYNTIAGSLPAGTTTYADGGLAAETAYDYRVRACNTSGCSSWSTIVATTAPAAPSALGATAASVSLVNLTWTDNSSAEDSVRIERRVNGGAYARIAAPGANATAYGDNTVSADNIYDYRVQACTAGGCSRFSNVATDTTPPIAPTGVGAVADSSTGITVSWTDGVATETRFELQRRTGGNAYAAVAGSPLAAGTTSYVDTGLTPNTTYDYRVRACNTSGCSAWITTAAATPQIPAPTAPSGLSATAASVSLVNLAWTDNSATEDSVRIERQVNGGAFARIAAPGANTTAYGDNTVTADGIYGYRVQACNAGGCSAFTAVATDTTPPIAPTGVGAVADSATGITVSWTDGVATETRFELQRRTGVNAYAAVAGSPLAAGTTSYVDTGLTPNTTYDYRVRACNTSGCSAWITTSASTPQIPAPLAPTSLTATVSGTGPVTLSWNDNASTEDSVRIERQVNGGGFTRIAAPGANTTGYSDNAVTADNAYGYRVQACNAGGCSAFSNQATATTQPVQATGLAITAVAYDSIAIAWTDASATETSFIILRRTGGSGPAVDIDTVSGNITAYTDTTVAPTTAYDYRVEACNAAGCASPSNRSSTVTTPPAPPAAPSGLSATAASVSLVNLAWTDNSATEDSVRIERQVNGGGFARIAAPGANTTAYGDNTVTADNVYGYRVQACNAGGCSAFSGVASDTTPPLAASGLNLVSATATTVDLGWTDNSSTETRFEVQRRTSGGALFTTLAPLAAANATSYQDATVVSGTTYDYQVLACNTSGCAPASNILQVIVP
jgi:fibronectin type 3 domain-containing protein